MDVFVTGGTGLIGSAVVAELVSAGHSALVLARSDRSAQVIEAAGATPLRGSLTDLDILRFGASETDGSIHLAFANDFSSADAVVQAVEDEAAALRTIGEALTNTGRPLVTVSGTPFVEGRPSTEDDPLTSVGPLGARNQAVTSTLNLATQGVRSAAIRLPRTVHTDGRGGFAGVLTELARASGVVQYPGDGSQRWPAVHAYDAAVLFRLVLEQASPGTAWHAVSDEGDAVGDMVEIIGRRLGLPVESVSQSAFGPLGEIFATDQPSSSTRTRTELGWNPTHPGLLEDLENIKP